MLTLKINLEILKGFYMKKFGKTTTLVIVIISVIIMAGCGATGTTIQLNFETNGGTSLASVNIPDKFNPSVTIDFPVSTKDGYILGGWYADSDFTKPINFPISSKDLFDIIDGKNEHGGWNPRTIYARWIEKEDFSLNRGNTNGNINNDGFFAMESYTIVYVRDKTIYKELFGAKNNEHSGSYKVNVNIDAKYLNLYLGEVYYVNDSDDGKIYKNSEPLLSIKNCKYLHIVEGELFFISNGISVNTIYKVPLNTMAETIIYAQNKSRFLNVYEDRLYFGATDDETKIFSIKKDGTDFKQISDTQEFVQDFLTDDPVFNAIIQGIYNFRIKIKGFIVHNGKCYYSSVIAYGLLGSEIEAIWGLVIKSDLDGSNGEKIILGEYTLSYFNVNNDGVFYMHRGSLSILSVISRIDHNGENYEKLLDGASRCICTSVKRIYFITDAITYTRVRFKEYL